MTEVTNYFGLDPSVLQIVLVGVVLLMMFVNFFVKKLMLTAATVLVLVGALITDEEIIWLDYACLVLFIGHIFVMFRQIVKGIG